MGSRLRHQQEKPAMKCPPGLKAAGRVRPAVPSDRIARRPWGPVPRGACVCHAVGARRSVPRCRTTHASISTTTRRGQQHQASSARCAEDVRLAADLMPVPAQARRMDCGEISLPITAPEHAGRDGQHRFSPSCKAGDLLSLPEQRRRRGHPTRSGTAPQVADDGREDRKQQAGIETRRPGRGVNDMPE